MDEGNSGGSARAVASILDIAGDFLEGDLLRYFGVDLYDVLRGKVAPRRVLALLRTLPPECRSSAVMRAHLETLRDNKPAPPRNPLHRYIGWDPVTQWLAIIAEQLVFYRYEHAKATGAKGLRAPKPFEVPGRNGAAQRNVTSLYALSRAAAGLGT